MWTTMSSPLGTVRVVAEEAGITAVEFLDGTAAPPAGERSSTAFAAAAAAGRRIGERLDEHPLLREAVTQLTGYFAGDLKDFALPLAPQGTPFQRSVWEQLRLIGYGETASYGDIARRIGRPTASRAVGAANGRNPIAIIVPCHRVIGADGSMTGFGGGIERKVWLLGHEKARLGSSTE